MYVPSLFKGANPRQGKDRLFCDNTRHAELADCELRAELDGKMAKPLQTLIVDPLNASNHAVSASLCRCISNEITTSHFTNAPRNDKRCPYS